MNNKTKNLLRLIAIIIVAVCVLLHIDILDIKGVDSDERFWLMVIAFALTLVSSR